MLEAPEFGGLESFGLFYRQPVANRTRQLTGGGDSRLDPWLIQLWPIIPVPPPADRIDKVVVGRFKRARRRAALEVFALLA